MKDIPLQEQPKLELDQKIKQKYVDALLDEAKIFEFVSTVPSWADNFTEDEKNLLWKLCVYFSAEVRETTLFQSKRKSEVFEGFDTFARNFTDTYSTILGKPWSTIYPYVGFMIKNYLEDVKRNPET